MPTSTNSLLARIRRTLVKSAAMEWVPDGRGGGLYRDLRASGSGPVVLGQRPAVSRGSASTRRWDQDLTNEALAHRQAMRDGSWRSPGYAARMRETGRSPASAQTNANLQEIRQLAAKYKMSPKLQQYLMQNPQELAKLRAPAPAVRQPVSTTAASVQPTAAPVSQTQQPVAATQVRQQPVQSSVQAVQAASTSSNPLENLLRQGRITQQEFDAASDPNRPRGGASPLFKLYQQRKLSRRDFDRMTARPPAAVTQVRQQPKDPAAPAGGQTTAGLGFGITDADLPKPLGQQTPVQSPAAKQYAEASKNFATGQVAQTVQQPKRQLGQGGGQTQQSIAGKAVTTCPTCGGSGTTKVSESAIPAAPKVPNPAPRPLKTPSFTTRPPTVGKAVADVRPGTASAVTPKTQSLGTAKATGAKQVSVSKPIMAPKEFTAIPTAPLAKTAGVVDWLKRNVFLNGDVLNALMKSRIPSGSAAVMVPNVFVPGTTTGELRPSADVRRELADSAKAALMAGTAYAAVPAGAGIGTTALMGGLGALGGANAAEMGKDAVRQAASGDYGGATRSAAGAVVSAGFPAGTRIPLAFKAALGAAGGRSLTDLIRSGIYAYNGMPDAAAGAAASAAGDMTMFLPDKGLGSKILKGLGLYGVMPLGGIYEQNAANRALDARTEKLYGPVATQAQDVATKVLEGHGVKVGPYADAIAETAQDAAAGAYAIDSDAVAKKLNPFSKFLTGLTGADDVVDLVARERMAENGITPGGRQAVADVNDLARKVAPQAKAIQDYQTSLRGRLDLALGWVGRNKGLVAAGTGASLLSLLVWRALANRRKKRQANKTVS